MVIPLRTWGQERTSEEEEEEGEEEGGGGVGEEEEDEGEEEEDEGEEEEEEEEEEGRTELPMLARAEFALSNLVFLGQEMNQRMIWEQNSTAIPTVCGEWKRTITSHP